MPAPERSDEFCEVVITAADAGWLTAFTRTLVEERLAACGQLTDPIRSIYRWEGAVHDETEARSRCIPAGRWSTRSSPAPPTCIPTTSRASSPCRW